MNTSPNPEDPRRDHGVSTRCRSGLLATFFLLAATAGAEAYGPFPPGTTVHVDQTNTTDVEDGTSALPFDTIEEGIAAAAAGDIVGVAPGTYLETLWIASPIRVIGFDAKTTIIDASQMPVVDEVDVVYIDSPGVRLSGFTIIGVFDPGDPDTANVIAGTSDPSVRIDHNVITGNCIGILTDYGMPGPGPTIDGNVIHGNICAGLFGSSGRIINNVFADNDVGIYFLDGYPAHIVNNTIVNNDSGGVHFLDHDYLGPAAGTIKNNIVADNGGYGLFIEESTQLRPGVSFNLFFNHPEGNLFDGAAFDTAAQINALPNTADNIVAPPHLVSPATQDFHLAGASPAIDGGTDSGAPHVDFEGSFRPQDGDGDCSAVTDMGAFEASVVVAGPIYLSPCRDYVFDPEQWIIAGCEVVDCCPFCPAETVLDWLIRVQGDPVATLVLRFEDLASEVADGLAIEGDAQWIGSGRLLMPGDGAVTVYGIPFEAAAATQRPARMTVELIAPERTPFARFKRSAAERREARRVQLEVEQRVEDKAIARATLDYVLQPGSR